MVGDIANDGGAADEANLAFSFEGLECLDGAVLLQKLLPGAEVELDDVQVVSLQASQTLFACVDDIVTVVVVQLGKRDSEPRSLIR